MVRPNELATDTVDTHEPLALLAADGSDHSASFGDGVEPCIGNAVDGESDGDAIETLPQRQHLCGIATSHVHVGICRQEAGGASGERLVDLDRYDRAAGRHHLAGERGTVPRARAELGDAVARRKTEHAKRQKVGVGCADGGEAVVVEEKRRVESALGNVDRTHEALARHVEQRREKARFERARASIDLDDQIDSRSAGRTLEVVIGGNDNVDLVRRCRRSRCVPTTELAEPLAREADVGGKESVVHVRASSAKAEYNPETTFWNGTLSP